MTSQSAGGFKGHGGCGCEPEDGVAFGYGVVISVDDIVVSVDGIVVSVDEDGIVVSVDGLVVSVDGDGIVVSVFEAVVIGKRTKAAKAVIIATLLILRIVHT